MSEAVAYMPNCCKCPDTMKNTKRQQHKTFRMERRRCLGHLFQNLFIYDSLSIYIIRYISLNQPVMIVQFHAVDIKS